MNDILMLTVPNEQIKQRRGFTGADWWWQENGNLQVRVAAELTDWRERACLAVHEITEAIMCRYLGITVQQVDEFDSAYQAAHAVDLNAGDEPDCPYRIPHTFATAIERVLAGVLGVNWKAYDDRLSVL